MFEVGQKVRIKKSNLHDWLEISGRIVTILEVCGDGSYRVSEEAEPLRYFLEEELEPVE